MKDLGPLHYFLGIQVTKTPSGLFISQSKQPTVLRSSAEAEYRVMATTTTELTWISFLLRDIGIFQPRPATLFCDNVSALHMTVNPVFHARSKHIEIDYHFVKEKDDLGFITTKFVPSSQ
ncbi:hypothetical protein CFOL_v3_29330 [Cephalotus follicularis]|uniref:RVT_2 domain-containing protein n=1 Tax=Cephalotus follicularis TaxID=3775 RepID=A0A1Q3D065_CEPFO|nr:hypothetical protein CFOL_v3_29330 [Cephalotus follicularis]